MAAKKSKARPKIKRLKTKKMCPRISLEHCEEYGKIRIKAFYRKHPNSRKKLLGKWGLN